MGAASGVLRGAGWGARLGAMLGPPGAIGGAIAGAIIGGAIYYGGKAIVNQMNKADEEAEELDETEEEGACADCGETALPEDPEDLKEEGFVEEEHPAPNRRRFRNPETGEVLDFDKGQSGRPGWGGKDHYHRPNPNSTGKGDANLDAGGNPVPRGSGASHIAPGTTITRPGTPTS